MVQSLWRIACRFLRKLKIEQLHGLAIPLLGIYLEKTVIPKDTWTPVFIAALFTIARTWNHPQCPLVKEWIKKIRYIYTIEYYSAIKKKEILPFAETWIDLETVKSGREKKILHNTTLRVESRKMVQTNLFAKQKYRHRCREFMGMGMSWKIGIDIYTLLGIKWASLVAQRLKRLPAMRETWVRSLGQEDPLEKEMATHSSILA